jgi:hypothetical protein
MMSGQSDAFVMALGVAMLGALILVAVLMYRLGYKHARRDFTERRTPPIIHPVDRYKRQF